MNLIWHIVRKDLRRLWLPLALWLVLLLAHTALLAVPVGPNATSASYEGLYYFANTWGVIVAAVGFILAAWLVMEDSLVDTQAFWTTRPISGVRLLAAKVLGAFLLLSLLPALVLTPVWLVCGFSFREWAWAAYEWAMSQAMLSVAAFALAGVTATSGQFLVRAIGGAVLLPVFIGYVMGVFAGRQPLVSAGLLESRVSLLMALLILTPLGLIVHQFQTRRAARTMSILSAGVLLMLGIKFAWTWDISPLLSKLDFGRGARALAADPGVVIKAEKLGGSADRDENGSFTFNYKWSGVITGVPDGMYLRFDSARGYRLEADNQTQTTFRFAFPDGRQEGPPEQAVRAVAGLSASAGAPATWSIESIKTGAGLFQVTLNASLMRGRVLGELPLRSGAELRSGSSLTRITHIERVDGRLVVQLEERDAAIGPPAGSYAGGIFNGRLNSRPATDRYLLLNRSQAYAQLPPCNEIGAVQVNSLMVGRVDLVVFNPPTRVVDGTPQEIPGWEVGTVIMKVRFTRDHPLVRILSTPMSRVSVVTP